MKPAKIKEEWNIKLYQNSEFKGATMKCELNILENVSGMLSHLL